MFLAIEKISENILSVNIGHENLKISKAISLADILFGEIGKINMLVGVGVFCDLICPDGRKLDERNTIIRNIKLG